jgi:hypothetical protein
MMSAPSKKNCLVMLRDNFLKQKNHVAWHLKGVGTPVVGGRYFSTKMEQT